MFEQLVENNARIKPSRFKANKKCLLITLGVAIAATVVIFLIIFFRVLSSHDYDRDPPGTSLPRKCGQRTSKSNWPWTVQIYKYDDSGWEETIALGTLVNHRYVLTSAYAIRKHKDSYLGLSVGEPPGLHRHIVSMKFIEHESFDFRGGINMVLLRLDKSVEFDDHVQPICLSWVLPKIPQQLTINPSDATGKLFSSSVQLVRYRDCFMQWYSDGFDTDWESMRLHLCAKQMNSSEHCTALPGSPLLGVFHDNGKERFVQYGIKHYGDCTKGLQIYTNVSFNMEWIQTTLNRYQKSCLNRGNIPVIKIPL